jgi:hypothetical protein
MRYLTGIVLVLAVGVACSRDPERRVAASPTGPTPTAVTAGLTSLTPLAGGVSGPMDMAFPPRNEPLLFRRDLETRYRDVLGRSASMTYVDLEGEVVWTQEYIRYVVNGCSHVVAVERVRVQIFGGQAGGICQAPPDFTLIQFPSRADSLEFRRILETIYQQLGRGLTPSFADIEGAVIWLQEYLRYRVNQCSHLVAEDKVFQQVSGGPVSPTCFVACSYILIPETVSVPRLGGRQSFEMRSNPVGCPWTAVSDSSWLTIDSGFDSGNTFTVIPYSVTTNNGVERTGRIRLTYAGGTLTFTVVQAGLPFGSIFAMFDNARSTTTAVNDCQIRTASNTCSFTATSGLPGSSSYTWAASYNYANTTRLFTQSGSSPNFAFTEACGLPGSSAEGATVLLELTLTITDNLGNSVTLQAGIHQEPLYLRLFTCP